jgi:Tfp pilus assembly protein FimT
VKKREKQALKKPEEAVKASNFRRGHAGARKGYTLVEEIIASAILVIVTGLAVTHYFKQQPRYLLERASLQIATDLSAARMRAIAESLPVEVSFTGDRTYTIWADTNTNGVPEASEKEERDLNDAACISLSTACRQGTFTPRGTFVSSNGVWHIGFSSSGAEHRHVFVLPSGQVRRTENGPGVEVEASEDN